MKKESIVDRKIPTLSSTKISVSGSTIINHQARTELNISCDEYVLIDCIEKLVNAKKPINYSLIWEYTGLEKDKVIFLMNEAVINDLLIPSPNTSGYKVTDKWLNAFKPVEVEFEQFWKSEKVNGKTISWTGSKPDALQKFMKVRKIESFDYLMKQKKDYFEMIGNSDWRRVMGCSVFLNITTKRYSEDWTKYDEGRITPAKEEPKRKLSKNEISGMV